MRKILVTGGAGFIGSCLAEALSEDPQTEVVVTDDLSTGHTGKIPKGKHDNVRFIKCNVNHFQELSGIFYANRFDYVFHYAAVVGVQRTLDNPLSVLGDINGLKNVAELSKSTGVKRVFYASSSEVYGEPVEMPQNEHTTPLNSRLPYAIVKNLGEAFFTSYQKEYELNYTIFRFFNTYGPKQNRDFVISKFIAAALKNEPITINGDGSQTRTFCYIDDNVEACINALNTDQFVNDVLNIGSDKETTILDLAQTIIRLTDSRSEIIHLDPLAEGDMKRRMADNTKMLKLLSRQLLPLEDGLKRVLQDTRFIL